MILDAVGRVTKSRRSFLAASLLTFLLSCPANLNAEIANDATAKQAARIAFANEFIRELAAAYKVQQQAIKELAEDETRNAKMMTGINISTHTSMDSQTNIRMLEHIHLDGSCAVFEEGLKSINNDRQPIHE